MSRHTLSFLCIVFVAALLSSCAVKVVPQGGKKDTNPPKVLLSSPDTMAVNFTGDKITIAFDEFIALREPSQIIISPPLKYEPEIIAKNKSVVIRFTDTLALNTTYSINFGNAIVDVNEGNVLEDYQFVFSTGPAVDTLFVAGKVLNASDLSPAAKVLVMLYTNLSDSTPMKERPLYYTKTDASGNFKINHIAEKTYRVFALNDKDADFLYNQPNEDIAFYELPLEAIKKPRLDLRLFAAGKPAMRLMKASYETPGKLSLIYTDRVDSMKIETINTAAKEPVYNSMEHSAQGDTLIYWINQNAKDTLHWILLADTLKADTIKLVQKKPEMLKGKAAKQGLQLTSDIASSIGLEQRLILTSNYPIKDCIDSLLLFKEDSVRLKPILSFADSSRRRLRVEFKVKEGASYSLYLPPAALTDIFGQTRDTLRMAFTAKKSKDYGTLKLHLNLPESGSFILQLVDDKGTLLEERNPSGNQVLDYTLLQPGSYRLKLIFDANYNKIFDSGDYMQHRQPEKIVYYSKTIAVKSNWDIEEDWKP